MQLIWYILRPFLIWLVVCGLADVFFLIAVTYLVPSLKWVAFVPLCLAFLFPLILIVLTWTPRNALPTGLRLMETGIVLGAFLIDGFFVWTAFAFNPLTFGNPTFQRIVWSKKETYQVQSMDPLSKTGRIYRLSQELYGIFMKKVADDVYLSDFTNEDASQPETIQFELQDHSGSITFHPRANQLTQSKTSNK